MIRPGAQASDAGAAIPPERRNRAGPLRRSSRTRSAGPLRIVVTAGPTRERIDPVRFISNYSTGSMGFAIAGEARQRGHSVALVAGPVGLARPRGVRVIPVEDARGMKRAVAREFRRADALIMAAAVCDWRPAQVKRGKLKKKPSTQRPGGGNALSLALRENPDILGEAGRKKGERVVVGFALETGRVLRNAREKLRAKNLDFIVANRLAPGKTVFGGHRADFLIIDRLGRLWRYPGSTKRRLASRIIDKVEAMCYSSSVEGPLA